MSLSFSTFIFSTGIKLFIQHPAVLCGILILQSSLMALCSFTHGVFVKTDSYVFINTWNTEFYIPLSLRQNKSRYKIWHWLELGCFCKWKQSTNKEIYAHARVIPPYLWIIKDKLGNQRYEWPGIPPIVNFSIFFHPGHLYSNPGNTLSFLVLNCIGKMCPFVEKKEASYLV